jgi:hypothetical protein
MKYFVSEFLRDMKKGVHRPIHQQDIFQLDQGNLPTN